MSISIITYAEVYQGIFYGKDGGKAEKAFLEFIQYMLVHDISRSVAKRFAFIRGELMKNKQTKNLAHPKNNYDLFIAATALEYGMTLVTSNVKDYKGIPNLVIFAQTLLING
jgi:tRNA(fMet)-specific endonuclease VapC